MVDGDDSATSPIAEAVEVPTDVGGHGSESLESPIGGRGRRLRRHPPNELGLPPSLASGRSIPGARAALRNQRESGGVASSANAIAPVWSASLASAVRLSLCGS